MTLEVTDELIAAAPELLQHCESLSDCFGKAYEDMGNQGNLELSLFFKDMKTSLDEVIAKAKRVSMPQSMFRCDHDAEVISICDGSGSEFYRCKKCDIKLKPTGWVPA